MRPCGDTLLVIYRCNSPDTFASNGRLLFVGYDIDGKSILTDFLQRNLFKNLRQAVLGNKYKKVYNVKLLNIINIFFIVLRILQEILIQIKVRC